MEEIKKRGQIKIETKKSGDDILPISKFFDKIISFIFFATLIILFFNVLIITKEEGSFNLLTIILLLSFTAIPLLLGVLGFVLKKILAQFAIKNNSRILFIIGIFVQIILSIPLIIVGLNLTHLIIL